MDTAEQRQRRKRIRIVVADDDPLVREVLRYRLEREPDMEITAEAADGEEAVRRVRELRPDVLLLDLVMPPDGGAATVPAILAAAPGARIAVLTNRRVSAAEARALVAAGIRGYLVKTAGVARLAEAIRTVADGGACFDPAIAALLVGQPSTPRAEPTSRELEVLHLVAEGMANRRIAETLGVCERTVAAHIASLCATASARDRAELVHRAHQKGWLI